MFKFTNIPAGELDKLREIKQGNTFKTFDLKGGRAPVTFTFPHDSYTLQLPNSFKQEADFKPFLSGIRVIEATKDHFQLIYDLNKTEYGSEPQMFMDKKFLETYEQAFNSILGTSMEEENYEVRILKIPAVHQEALWLHKEANQEEDKFLPVKRVRWEKETRIYTRFEFFKFLNELTIRSNDNRPDEMDSMIGG